MKTIIVLSAVIVASFSKNITKDSQTIKSCLEHILHAAGKKSPEMQDLLDAYHTPFFELVDKYIACQSESIFNDVRCQFELEETALLYKKELEENISDKYRLQLDELMKDGRKCLFGKV